MIEERHILYLPHSQKFFAANIFFNVHARIACNAKAFRNVVLNQSFKFFFSPQPFKTVFHSSFLFLKQNIASSACTMEKCLSRLWIANLKEVFFYELITINNQIEFIRMGLKHVFYFYLLYHWTHKKIRVSVYISSASVHAKCDRKLLPSILQTSSAVFFCVEVNKKPVYVLFKILTWSLLLIFCNLPFRMCTC